MDINLTQTLFEQHKIKSGMIRKKNMKVQLFGKK